MPTADQPAQGTGVTLLDIAKKCGVVKGTVSKALNHQDKLINPQTAENIRAVAREMGYDPMSHHAARRLSYRKSGRKITNHLIGVFMPAFFYKITYYTEIYYGILDTLTREHFGLLTIPVPDLRVDSSDIILPPALLRDEVDGIILVGIHAEDHPILQNLYTRSRDALATVSLIFSADDGAAVLADDESGGYQTMSHLLDIGHRDCLYVKNSFTTPAVRQRIVGMQRALTERGLDQAQHLHILWGEVNRLRYYPPFVENTAEALEADNTVFPKLASCLNAHPEITAIITQNDTVAHEIWYSFKYLGIHIPEEYSLVGFDDTEPLLGEYGGNVLTTVHLPLSDLGRAAARVAIDLVNGVADAQSTVVLPPELVVRKTTAPPMDTTKRRPITL